MSADRELGPDGRCPWKWQKQCPGAKPAALPAYVPASVSGEPPVQWGLFGGGEAFKVGDPNGEVYWMFEKDGVAISVDELSDSDWREIAS